MNVLLIIFASWITCLIAVYLWKSPLLKRTWQEPYFADTPVLIESDDWGPGDVGDAERLGQLLGCLESHKDSVQRVAVITADVVLGVPDVEKITADPDFAYHRKMLDEGFPEIHGVMLEGVKTGSFVPQLHGLEHLNGKAFAQLSRRNDPRIAEALADPRGWNWESLDSPLQGHYVDGSSLPTQAIGRDEAKTVIALATRAFQDFFGCPSISTVAPCYLWNSDIENVWQQHGIQFIQTAGYRCDGRDANGAYRQDRRLIRPGDLSGFGQVYLVRNVMYEPVDGKNTPDTAYREALSARAQALPVSLSTHRYNYTRGEADFHNALAGLDQLLSRIGATLPNVRFISSPELGEQILNAGTPVINHFNEGQWPPLKQLTGIKKIAPFLNRLHARHPKLTLLGYSTGLIIPAWLICKLERART
jgi:hypothetical protein